MKIKKFLSILLTLAMVLTMLPAFTVTASAAEPEWNTFGGCVWSIDSEGTLTIKPTDTPAEGYASGQLPNNMSQFGNTKFEAVPDDEQIGVDWPWYNHNDEIKKVVVAKSGDTKVVAGNSLAGMFRDNTGGYEQLSTVDLSGLDISNVTDMTFMFDQCQVLTSVIWPETLNTSNLTSLWCVFGGCTKLGLDTRISYITNLLNGNGGKCTDWTAGLFSKYDGTEIDIKTLFSGNSVLNLNEATCMDHMFANCFYLKTIIWPDNMNTSKVVSMYYMFGICSSLTSLDLSEFDTSNVTTMLEMFRGCSKLETIKWPDTPDTSNVTDMSGMFVNCTMLTAAKRIDNIKKLLNSNNGNCTNWTESLFSSCTDTTINLSGLNLRNITSMEGMFSGCSNLTSITWPDVMDTSKVVSMSDMFSSCSSLEKLDLSKFDTSSVMDMSNMFKMSPELGDVKWPATLNTSNVTKMGLIFHQCKALGAEARIEYIKKLLKNNGGKCTDWMEGLFSQCSDATIDISELDLSNPTSMAYMFAFCSNLTSITWPDNMDTSKVVSMANMFQYCSSLETLDLSKFDTSSVTTMGSMFQRCFKLTALDLSKFDTSRVTNMQAMFNNCQELTTLDLSMFDTSNVERMDYMFSGSSSKLAAICVGDKWNTDALRISDGMFNNCTCLVGGKGTKYDANHVDAAYAHVDSTENPGYLTPAVCSITKGDPAKTTYYLTLQNAVNDAKYGDTIVLESDVNEQNGVSLQHLFLNINGHKLSTTDINSWEYTVTAEISGLEEDTKYEVMFKNSNGFGGSEDITMAHGQTSGTVTMIVPGPHPTVEISKYVGGSKVSFSDATVVTTFDGGILYLDEESTISFSGSLNDCGTIVVDMTGATENTYKLMDYIGSTSASCSDYKFADGKDNGYELVVENYDLIAKKSGFIFDDCFGGNVTKYNYKTWEHGDYTLDGWYYDNAGIQTKLGDSDPQKYVTYTAIWTKNGKSVITEAIDLSAPTGDASGDGWVWNNQDRILTLTDAIIDIEDIDAYRAITLPTDSKLVLNGTSDIILKNTGTNAIENAVAVKCAGTLDISGTGTLNITSASEQGKAWGVEVCTSLTYQDATLNISSQNDAINVLPAGSEDCTMTVNSGKITTTVTETADSGNNGITVQKGTFNLKYGEIQALGGCHGIVAGDSGAPYTGKIIIEGGTVNASAANSGLWAYGDIEISGGIITAAATGTDANDYAINSQNGNIVIYGATSEVTANGAEYGIRSKAGSVSVTDAAITASGAAYSIYAKTDFALGGTGKVTAGAKLEAGNIIGDKTDHCYTVINGNSNILNGTSKSVEPENGNTMEISNKDYTVSINGADVATKGYLADDLAELAAPVRSGYKFIGWFADEECTNAWNFAVDYVRSNDVCLYPGWVEDTENVTATIIGNVKDSNSADVSDAIVELWIGSEKLAATTTDVGGQFNFTNIADGIYNIVVTKENLTTTQLYTVPNEGIVSIAMQSFTTKVETSDADVVVDGLKEVIASATDIVKFNIESKAADSADEAQEKITEQASGKTLEYFDIKLTKNTMDIGNDNDKVLTIIASYDTSRKGIKVYRYHGTSAVEFTNESAPMLTPADGHFYVDTANKLIYIYASKFSTYAIGYTEDVQLYSGPSSYSVTVKAAENGSVKTNSTSATEGSTVTFTVTPDEGYELESVTVVDSTGKEITATKPADGKYTFTMPGHAVTVSAKFAKKATKCAQDDTCVYSVFTDADVKAWYHGGVHFCVENKYMTGYDDTTFGPTDTLSRGMIVQMLYNMEGRPAVAEKSSYSDVAEDKWYADAIAWAEDNAVVDGYGNGTFGPEDNITREQLAKIFYGYAKLKGYSVSASEALDSFTDAAKASSWAVESLKWAKAVKLINGKEDGSILDPTGLASRAEAATILYNFCSKVQL